MEEIKADIDRIASYRNDILTWMPHGAPHNNNMLEKKLNELPEETMHRYLHILHWMSGGEESVFLQDANTLVLTFDKLL